MKVAVLSESPDNEAAIRILVRAIVGRGIETLSPPPLAARGWPAIEQVLPAVLTHLAGQTDADALAVVADSDDSPIHNLSHEEPGGGAKDCRLCRLRAAIARFQKRHEKGTTRRRMMIAVGIPVPCIEAWYRCGTGHEVSEKDWAEGAAATSRPYTRNDLKRWVYGTDRPDRACRKRHAVQSAERLADSVNRLEALFPGGFGPFVRDVRSWSA